MDSYRNSFSSLSDLSQMFAAPPSLATLHDYHHHHQPPPDHQQISIMAPGMNKERERRGKMANMYSILHTFLPNLKSTKHPSREKIVTEAIDFIKKLEVEKSRLEQQLVKSNAALITDVVSNEVSVSTLNDVVAFEIKRRGDVRKRRLVELVEVFEKYGVEVVHVSVVVGTVGVTAAIVGGDVNDVVERIKRDLLNLV